MSLTQYLLIFFFSLSCISTPVMAEDKEAVAAMVLINAYNSGNPLPLVSQIHADTTIKQAYKIQKRFIQARRAQGGKIAGFKAGLTSKKGQKRFAIDQAVAGVLWQTGKHQSQQIFNLSNYHRLMLETELGYQLATDITAPIDSIETLKTHISAVLPIIELPNLDFISMKGLTAVDLISANVSAASFIVGTPYTDINNIDINNIDINHIKTSLKNSDQTLIQGQGSDALGDQWQALLWVVNKMLAEGYSLQKGQVVITGALGKMVKAQTGNYTADFAELGQISFSIQP